MKIYDDNEDAGPVNSDDLRKLADEAYQRVQCALVNEQPRLYDQAAADYEYFSSALNDALKTEKMVKEQELA